MQIKSVYTLYTKWIMKWEQLSLSVNRNVKSANALSGGNLDRVFRRQLNVFDLLVQYLSSAGRLCTAAELGSVELLFLKIWRKVYEVLMKRYTVFTRGDRRGDRSRDRSPRRSHRVNIHLLRVRHNICQPLLGVRILRWLRFVNKSSSLLRQALVEGDNKPEATVEPTTSAFIIRPNIWHTKYSQHMFSNYKIRYALN